MASTAVGPSATWGWPPASEKRPMTGTRPGVNTAALDRRAPWPLLSKLPAMQTPLAWLRRKPGWTPLHLLEPVDETRLAEAARREPAAHIGKAERDDENAGADRGQSHQRAAVAQ